MWKWCWIPQTAWRKCKANGRHAVASRGIWQNLANVANEACASGFVPTLRRAHHLAIIMETVIFTVPPAVLEHSCISNKQETKKQPRRKRVKMYLKLCTWNWCPVFTMYRTLLPAVVYSVVCRYDTFHLVKKKFKLINNLKNGHPFCHVCIPHKAGGRKSESLAIATSKC